MMFEADAGHSVAVENFAVPATSNEERFSGA